MTSFFNITEFFCTFLLINTVVGLTLLSSLIKYLLYLLNQYSWSAGWGRDEHAVKSLNLISEKLQLSFSAASFSGQQGNCRL